MILDLSCDALAMRRVVRVVLRGLALRVEIRGHRASTVWSSGTRCIYIYRFYRLQECTCFLMIYLYHAGTVQAVSTRQQQLKWKALVRSSHDGEVFEDHNREAKP